MNKYIKAVFEVKSYMKCNMIIYYINKLPIIGYRIADLLFENMILKKFAAIFSNFMLVLILSSIKLCCIVTFVIFPMNWYATKTGLLIHDFGNYYIQAVFFLFCIMGSFQESRTFLVSKCKYICITHLKMPVKECVLSFSIIEYFLQFISIALVFAVTGLFLGESLWIFIVLLVEYISLQLISESLHLYVYQKKHIPLEKNKFFSKLLLVFSLIGAYGPLLLGPEMLVTTIIRNPLFVLLIGVGGMLSVYYIFVGFKDYNYELAKNFKREAILQEIIKKDQEAMFNKDIEVEFKQTKKAEKLRGYDLLNHIFLHRNIKSFNKYFKWRITFWVVALGGAFVWIQIDFDIAHKILENIYRFIPLLPLILCPLAYGEGFCKFTYNNCDSKLLSFAFYRTRQSLMKNYFIRLKDILKYNIVIGIISAACISLILLLGKVSIMNIEIITLLLVVFWLLIVFGIHHLSIYYLFQPYIKGSMIPNPIIVMSQMPLILLTYVLTIFKDRPALLMGIILIISIIYVLCLIILVSIKSVKTFRLK